jgi:hypothetical protein
MPPALFKESLHHGLFALGALDLQHADRFLRRHCADAFGHGLPQGSGTVLLIIHQPDLLCEQIAHHRPREANHLK